MRGRGHEAHAVAHFLNKLLFCMFAEDAGLLPRGLVRRLAGMAQYDETIFTEGLGDLFAKMAMACGAEYVVTGNRAHFPEAFCRGTTVVSPAGFVAAYRERPA